MLYIHIWPKTCTNVCTCLIKTIYRYLIFACVSSICLLLTNFILFILRKFWCKHNFVLLVLFLMKLFNSRQTLSSTKVLMAFHYCFYVTYDLIFFLPNPSSIFLVNKFVIQGQGLVIFFGYCLPPFYLCVISVSEIIHIFNIQTLCFLNSN